MFTNFILMLGALAQPHADAVPVSFVSTPVPMENAIARKAGGRKYRLHHKMKKLREKRKKEAKAAMA